MSIKKKISCDKLISFPCSAILDLHVFLSVFLFSRKAQNPKKRLSAIRLGVTVAGIWWNPGITFSLAESVPSLHPTGDFFNSPFKGPGSAECAVVPIPQGSCSRCVTNLLEAFSKCISFCLCFPTPHKVLWIITAPAQPLLLPRITSQSVMWRDLKWLSHLKSRVLLSYSFSSSLWACEWEFEEDRSCAVNYLGQY